MAVPAGLEPATSAFEARHSIQLSYGTGSVASLGRRNGKNQVFRVAPRVLADPLAHRARALRQIERYSVLIDSHDIKPGFRYAAFLQEGKEPQQQGLADPLAVIRGQEIESVDAIRNGVSKAHDRTLIGRDQQQAVAVQGSSPSLLRLADFKPIRFGTEQGA